jgi:O-antigen ligase
MLAIYQAGQAGLIALLIFTPLAFGSVEVWSRSVLEMAAFGLAGTALLLRGFSGGAEAGRMPAAPMMTAGLFFVAAGLQWGAGNSLEPAATRDALVLGLAYLSAFVLVVLAVRREGAIRRVALALIVLGFAIAVFDIIQMYAWNGRIYWLREAPAGGSGGPFVNRNHFAGYMELIIPLSIGYAVAAFSNAPLRGQTAWRRFVHRVTGEASSRLALLFFAVVVMAVSLVLSLSRAGLVSFLTALLVVGGALYVGRATRRWIALPVALLVSLAVSLLWFGLGPLIDRYATLFRLNRDESMLGRILVWRDALGIVRDHPVLGSGLGTFRSVFPAYKTFSDPVLYDHAHNDYVQLLAETGWAGFILALGTLGLLLGLIVAGWRRRRNPWARGLLAGLLTGMLAILIHGFSDFNFHVPSNALLFAVFLGLAFNLARPGEEGEAASAAVPARQRIVSLAGAAVFFVLMLQSAAVLAADRDYRLGLSAEKAGDLPEAERRLEGAIGWDGARAEYHFVLARIHERQYDAGQKDRLESARAEIERAIDSAPTVAEYRLHLGWIEAESGDPDAATAAFDRALALDPTNNNYRHYAGLWYAATGQKDKAKRIIEQLRENHKEGMAKEIEEKLESGRE